jgi:SAM-dependent methyltransferase
MSVIGEGIGLEVSAYLADVRSGIASSPESRSVRPPTDATATASELFSLLTSREFCYLGRTKAEGYRDDVVASLLRRMATGGAFRFFYDIGPGYHATTRPGTLPLSFDVGLSELLMLYQANALCQRIARLYEPGAHFFLVVDNLCALRTNEIGLEQTEGYVRKFRQLIEETGLSGRVELLVESEEFDLIEYDRLLADIEDRPPVADPTPQAVDNVARFLGRACTAAEAAERIERYRRTGAVTERLFDRLVKGVHMTQRATGATLGFRPFPGGDQRTQVGELALTRSEKGRLRPVLITTRNVDDFACVRLELPDVLPAPITHVTFASPRAR